MKPQCVALVNQAARAAGRNKDLTDAQLADIDSRLRRTMRQLARTDEDWQAKSPDQRLMEAATQAMEDMRAEADRKVQNVQLQILKTAATEKRVTAHIGENGRSGAWVHDIDLSHEYITGIKHEAMGSLARLMDAVKSGQGASAGRRVMMFLWDAHNPAMSRDLAAEIFGNADGHTGNKLAQTGAKAWLDTIESMRQRFNSAGGDVGRLDYGYLPLPHDSGRIRGNASGAARDKWVAGIMGKLDRDRYVDEAGAKLNDGQMVDLLRNVWETISTDGLNKTEPGQFMGTGARANRGSHARELHFKDADSYLAYLADYGRGSMYDSMTSHVGRMARDIGLVERYGPNPNAQARLQLDLARRADGDIRRVSGMRPQSYWDAINGTAASPDSARIAQIGTDARNIQTFGKLAGAVISSITDLGTYMVTTGYAKLPYWDAIANIGRTAASRETREFLTTHGIIAESMIGDMNRWTGDNIRQTWSGRLAQSTLKLSLMNAWTDTLRRAFSLTMMQGLARMSKTEWGALTEWDRTHLERKGITPEDWAVIQRAELTEFHGAEHLTPESIHATGDASSSEVVAKVLGLIQDESEYAVLNPDLATKVLSSGASMQRGTVRGELARSVMQFKSFPIAMVSRHFRRMLDAPRVSDGSAPLMANRLVYSGAMLVTTTALGAIALQAKQIASGKDPIDMTGPHGAKFWAKATAQGGGLSIVGDMLLNDPGNSASDWARSTGGTLLGPAASTAIQTAAIPVETVWNKAKGKPTHALAESINVARQNLPYVNLWYAKAALDHAGMHALQENLSPGYLGKMQARAAQDWNQHFWWTPGTGAPDRGPNLSAAVGQ